MNFDAGDKQKEARESLDLTSEIIIAWLGIVNMFQTFEDLESVKDSQAGIKAIRKLLDSEKPKEPKQ